MLENLDFTGVGMCFSMDLYLIQEETFYFGI